MPVGLALFDPTLVLRAAAQLSVVLVLVRLASMAARRARQAAVTAEIAVGIVLGPSVLGWLWPAAGRFLVPTDPLMAAPLNVLAWLGVTLLVLLVGAEVDPALLRGRGTAVAAVVLGALTLPFAAGLGVAYALPPVLRGPSGGPAVFALFIAVTMSVSALPVIARVFGELDLLRSAVGTLTLGSALVIDMIGWAALGVVTALAHDREPGTVGSGALVGPLLSIVTLVTVAGLVALVLLGVRRWARARESGPGRSRDGHGEVVAAVVAVMLLALVAQAVGSEGVVGAFLAGLLLRYLPTIRNRAVARLEPVTFAVLAPVFFVVAGLRVDLTVLADSQVLFWAFIYLTVAVVAKLVGTGLGGLAGGLDRVTVGMLAVGLNCRGAVEIVIASVGLSLGVLTTASYTVVVLMALVTTAMAPPLLRLLQRIQSPSPIAAHAGVGNL